MAWNPPIDLSRSMPTYTSHRVFELPQCVYLQQHLAVWCGFPPTSSTLHAAWVYFNWLTQKAMASERICVLHVAAHSLSVLFFLIFYSMIPCLFFQTPLNIFFLILWQLLSVADVQSSQPTQWSHTDSLYSRQHGSYWCLVSRLFSPLLPCPRPLSCPLLFCLVPVPLTYKLRLHALCSPRYGVGIIGLPDWPLKQMGEEEY